MNKEKTKVIWIGRKKLSKDKLNFTIDLEWGCTDFTHYTKALEKIKKLVKTWSNRYLTPLGKITVIKTNLISQCVHLLSTIPRSESFLKTLNTILYKFLWNGKPDKIRRSTISLSYMQGGMKMINIHNFDKSLKISWIKKLITQPNSQWHKLLTVMYRNINKSIIFAN